MLEFASLCETLRAFKLAKTLSICAEEGVDIVLRSSDLELVILGLMLIMRSSAYDVAGTMDAAEPG